MGGMFDDLVPTPVRSDLPVLCDVTDCHCRGTGHAIQVARPASHGKRLPIIGTCHPMGECLTITLDGHEVEVDRLEFTDSLDPIATPWRTACNTCGTVLSDRHDGRSAALVRAMAHVIAEVNR